jgi:hypothetical protein
MFNINQVMAFLRQALTFAGAYQVGHGTMTNDQSTAIVGCIVALASIAWSMIEHSKAEQANKK